MIVYNIEDFVIKQMFNPYKTLLIPEDNLPENGLDRMVEYSKREKACISELRKRPEQIMEVLRKNKEAYQCVFGRLAEIDFEFYKWLQHPLIYEIRPIITAFRMSKDGVNNE